MPKYDPADMDTWQNFDPNNLNPDWEEHLLTCPGCGNETDAEIRLNGMDEMEMCCRSCGCQYRLQVEVKVGAVFAEGVNTEIWKQVIVEFEEKEQ